jgi:hypothetical protein
MEEKVEDVTQEFTNLGSLSAALATKARDRRKIDRIIGRGLVTAPHVNCECHSTNCRHERSQIPRTPNALIGADPLQVPVPRRPIKPGGGGQGPMH